MKTARRGFTLIELLIASTVSTLVVLALVSTFVQQRRAYKAIQLINDMDQNVRAALDMVSRDVRTAGYGLSFPRAEIASWITWPSATITNYITVQDGGTGSDTLHLVGAYDVPSAFLASASAPGATTLTLRPGQASAFNTWNRRVIYVGRSETARITSISGDTLTISTHPTTGGVGLKFNYDGGAPVELVSVITYSQASDPGTYPYKPHLRRDDNRGTMAYSWQKMTASNIESFQVTPTVRGATVSVTARTDKPDYNYNNPPLNDRYRRRTLTTACKIRKPE